MSPIYARPVHLATSVLAIGWPEDGLTQSQAQNLYIGGIIVCAIAIIFVPGTLGANRYGADPLGNSEQPVSIAPPEQPQEPRLTS